ncbi:MAG: conserved membrane protein of unknown function [Promethearchaeota archaeon]|nr:MAG: conserved membrane protein of unknown function [Candidatus Lokiarchaeota archaeon]
MKNIPTKNSSSAKNDIEHYGTNIFSRSWAYVRSLKPLFLSHHPDCQRFEKHIFRIRKYRFCIGCFIGYPVAIISIVVLYFLLNLYEIDPTFLFWMGVGFMTSFILSPLKLTRHKPIKIGQKILFNIGGAFLFWWAWSITSSFIFNLLLFIGLFSILFGLVNAYHSYGLYATCRECEYHLQWEVCPGFQDIFRYCEENNLPNLFKQVNLVRSAEE